MGRICFLGLLALLAGTALPALAAPGSKAEALRLEQERVERIMQSKRTVEDTLKHQLRLASMALDAGDRILARETLMQVTQQLMDLQDNKNFQQAARRSQRALGGAESDKYFLGEPYEQLFAFIYLGILDFQAGDYEYARSSFRAAQAADQLSNLEGHRSDSHLAFVLEGLASKALGETDAMDDAFRMAEMAYVFRRLMESVPAAFQAAARAEPGTGKDPQSMSKRERRAAEQAQARYSAAMAMVATYLGVGLAGAPSPRHGIDISFEYALARLDAPGDFSEALDYLKLFDKKEIAAGAPGATILRLREVVEENLDPGIDAAADVARDEIQRLIARYRDPAVNVYLINEFGISPSKRRGGAYGSQQTFVQNDAPARHEVTLIEPVGAQRLLAASGGLVESVDYQALTRGGRYMDYLLAGQATTKRRLGVAADIIGSTGNMYADAVAGMLRLFARGIRSEADVRAWNELPGEMGLQCASLEPGDYRIAVQRFDNLGRLVVGESPVRAFSVEPGQPVMIASRPEWN